MRFVESIVSNSFSNNDRNKRLYISFQSNDINDIMNFNFESTKKIRKILLENA